MMFVILIIMACFALALTISLELQAKISAVIFVVTFAVLVAAVVVFDAGVTMSKRANRKAVYAEMTARGRALTEFRGEGLVNTAKGALVSLENKDQAQSYIAIRSQWLAVAMRHNIGIRKRQEWMRDAPYFFEYLACGERLFSSVEDAEKYIIEVSAHKGGK